MSSRRTRPRVVTGVLAVLLAASWSPLPRGTAVDVAATSSRAVDPVVNVARGKPVRANVTCGSPVEDFYPHSDSVKPPPDRQLQICDASDPVLGHNASLMTDGNSSTWWQSTSLRQLMSTGNGLGNQAEVYITLDLGETYHPENITIHMGDTKRPGRLAIMKSADGRNFDPWLYLVTNGNSDCRRFGVANLQPEPDSPESVVCREYPQLGVEQLYNERIIVSLFEVPPSFSDEDLLRWQAVRHLQLHFYDMDLVLGIFEDQFHHYAVSEVSVMAGCECNGLGNGCEISADSGQYECICSGNTQGPFCEECQPLYNQFPYQPGQPCRACNCNNHSQVCVYNETVAAGNLSMSANGSFHGGGVCLSCRDNTTGTNCEQCDTLFYRNPEVSHQSSLACLPCECDLVGSSSSQCNMETGQCPCKPGVGGRMCDVCLPGYYNFSSGGCIPCPCYPLLHHTPCYVDQGGQVTCNCTQGHKGEQCERCEDFYWGDPVHGTACAECDCSGNSDQCSNVTGECIGCHGNTTGFNCDRCADGFYGDAVFGNCSACACDESGSVALVCNHTTGLCPCKPGVDTSTRRCSGCMENHYGFDTPDGDGTDSQPGCSPCNCNDLGSTSLQCGEGGNCSCLPGVEGTKCDVCMEGTYGLPDMECLACDCDPVGTLSDFDPFLPTTTQSAVGQTTILGLTTTQDITTQGALIGSTPIQGITDDTTLQAETTAIPTTVATTNVTSSATSQVLETPGVTTGQAETTDTATTVDTTNVTLSATSQGPETPGVTTVQAETTDTATNVTSSATSQGPETPGVTTVQAETTDTATNVTSSATSQGPETPSVTTVQAETTDTATNVTSSATSQGPETPGVTTVQAETTDTATTVDTTNVTSSATSQGPETPSVTTVQAETTDTATTVDTTNVTTSATSQGPEAPGATTVQAETTDTATNVTTSATSQGPETPGVTTVQAETTAIPTTVAATNDTSSATSQGPETPGVTTVQAETTDTTTTVATTNSTSSATSQGPETTDVTTVQETTDTVATTNGTTSTTDTGLGTTDFAGTTNVTSVVAITNDMTVPTETTNITTAVTSTDGLETIGVTTVQTETTDIATVVTTTNDTLDVSVATEVVTTDNDTAVTENATTVTPLATANVPAVSTNATETSTTNNGTGRFVEEGFQARQRRQVAQQSTTVSTPVDTTDTTPAPVATTMLVPVTRNHTCQRTTGQCKCKKGVGGRSCNVCLPMYHGFGEDGCSECSACEQTLHRFLTVTESDWHRHWRMAGEVTTLQTLDRPLQDISVAIETVQQDLNQSALDLGDVNETVSNLTGELPILNRTADSLHSQVSVLFPVAQQLLNSSSAEYMRLEQLRRTAQDVLTNTTAANQTAFLDISQLSENKASARTMLLRAEQLLDNLTAVSFNDLGQQSQAVLAMAENASQAAQGLNATISTEVEEATAVNDSLTAAQTLLSRVTSSMDSTKLTADIILKAAEDVEQHLSTAEGHRQQVAVLVNETASLLSDAEMTLQVADLVLRNATLEFEQTEALLNGENGWTATAAELNSSSIQTAAQLTALTAAVQKAEAYAANLTVQADAVDNVFQTARLQGQAAVNAILGYQEASLLLNESAAIAQEVNATVQNLTEYIQSVSIATLEGRANQSLAASWELQEELDGRNMSAAGLLQEVRSANANLSAAQMEWGSVGDQLQLLDGELQGAEAAAQEGDITTSLEEGFRLVETAANQSTAAEVDIAEVSSGVEGVRGQLVVIQETSNNMTTIVADLQQTVSGTNGTLQAFLQQVQNVSQLQTDATTMQARLEQRMARLQTKMLQLEQAAQRLNSPMHFDSNTSAMLELPASRSPVFSSIAMDTRVGQLNESAVLVYGENHQTGEFLLVSMEDEHMTFTFNVSGDQQKPIRVDSNLRLCTNCWYHVQATRYRNEGTLTVTDLDTQATTSVQASDPEVTGTDLTLTSALYVGGAPLGAQVVQSGRYGGFAGCVANLEVEGQPLNLWTTPLPITGTPSCCQYPPSTSNPQPGVSFDGFGYLILSDQNFNIISQSQISLQFRTFNTHAVILLAEGEGGYYGLFLEEGHLVFQLEDSGINPGRENVTSDLIYNDGTWYELTVSTFPGVSVTMVMRNMIDGTVVENKTAESHLVLGGGGGGTQIVLGSQHPNQTNSVGPTSVKFAGCLQDVRLNDRTVQLNTNSSSSADVSFQGCLPQVVPGVGFRDDSSFSQLAVPLDYRGAAEIRFELKPDKLDGVLLYAEDSSDADHFFYLALYNGHLFGVHQPAQGQAQVLQPSSNLLVDQQWHLVELNITAGSISVQVDRSGEASAGVLTGALSSAHLYLAGVGPALQEKLNRCEECPVVVSYTGGMQGVSVNSRVLDFLDPATVLSQRGVYLSGLDPPQNVTAPTLPPPGPTVAPPSCADPFQPAYSREGVNFGRHGNSYISYSLSPETMVQYFRTSFVLRCQFRAEAPDGILYYSANFRINPDNHLGLYMSEGYLHADMRTQQASNGDYHSLKVRTQFRDYADGNWWEVVILRIHNFLAIIVPERRDYVNNNQQSNIQTFINLDTPFYVGGTDILASGLSFPLPIKAGFAGCIRLLEISTAQPVDTVSFDLGSPDDHFNIGQCYEAVQPGTAFNGTGFITMGTQSLESGLDVSVQFSTVQRSFLLLLLYQDPGNYFLMDAEDGRIRGHLRKNNITTTIRTTHVTGYEICDGEFHTLVFSANLVQRVGVLLLSIQLDELPDNRFQQTGFDDISIDGELYVGGGPVAASLASPGLVQTPFKGCLESLVFGEALDLRQAGLTEHVTSGCPARP
ncbi:uncharacterized protein LOC144868761 isoform X3 [Branchiostoma floridae x Branchiostoma japonicum]